VRDSRNGVLREEARSVTTMTTVEPTGRGPGGAGLAHDLRGEGLPVVQLHGLSSSRRRDTTLGLDVTAGQEGLRVLRYDARGHGESPGSVDPVDYTWPRLADDLFALLDEVFPDRPVHGVGQSMGAATLLTAAVADPARFASLALVLPPTVWEWRFDQSHHYDLAARQVERWGGARWAEVTRRPPASPAIDPARPFTVPDVADAWLPSVFRGAAATDLPPQEEVAGIALPTFLLAWPGDPAHPLSVAEHLDRLLPDTRLAEAGTPEEVADWPRLAGEFIRGRAEQPR
jgi:3-oxoadipate enol-lactonase